MKFPYLLSVILIGALSLSFLVIIHRDELLNSFRRIVHHGEISEGASPPGEQGKDNTGDPVREGVKAASDMFVEQTPEAKALTQLVNNHFEKATHLYQERLEIQKRQQPNGRYSPRDQKRLREIHIAVYSHLKAIDDEIEGATQPYLSRRSGNIKCGYFLEPEKLKARLGIVPEEYYRFDKVIRAFWTKPVQLETK